VKEGLALLEEASATMAAALGPDDIRAARVAGWLDQLQEAVR
jgi:hypothetical protein